MPHPVFQISTNLGSTTLNNMKFRMPRPRGGALPRPGLSYATACHELSMSRIEVTNCNVTNGPFITTKHHITNAINLNYLGQSWNRVRVLKSQPDSTSDLENPCKVGSCARITTLQCLGSEDMSIARYPQVGDTSPRQSCCGG